jgi:hypothetical protein
MSKDIAYSASARAFQAFKEDFEEYKKAIKTTPEVSAWDTLNFCKVIEKKKIVVFKTSEI